ncbi:uncharacterized protein LOC124438631 [Xenia sp. Carnegie-2017]|uniref:uncharacterized protein LOC124438631 n=1 Tax=Xenia sp. Carnegie-2017 TaxID=2897299 RepID=UPI001F0485A5|nr:uncharacterized protein LOC124438631 [Xenia sp. Carnegie-2017]
MATIPVCFETKEDSTKRSHSLLLTAGFFHDNGTRRKWISYSLSEDSLFCIPCILFTDGTSRGEYIRSNQGKAFANIAFSKWKKQYIRILEHEKCNSHLNAKVAETLFLQENSISDQFHHQGKIESERRKKKIVLNKTVLKRVIDAIMFLEKEGLSFRGHCESLTNFYVNTGNFLETLKLLSEYDQPINEHLEKVCDHQVKQSTKDGGKTDEKGIKGRGSWLTFLSNDIQNKLINITGKEISSVIVQKIRNCKAWALIADTTPYITHTEQLSICVRLVNETGECSEHVLSCQKAIGTTAHDLYTAITTKLQLHGVSFEKLVAQKYDGASLMSGCYNGLQAIVKEKIGNHIIYVHCYGAYAKSRLVRFSLCCY